MAERWFVYGEQGGAAYRWGPYLSRDSAVRGLNKMQRHEPKRQAFVRIARGAYEYLTDRTPIDRVQWFVFTRAGAEHIKQTRAAIDRLLPWGPYFSQSPIRPEFRTI